MKMRGWINSDYEEAHLAGMYSNIRVVLGLPGGLTERSIEAARRIKFVPATKDGKNVSMWMQLEYNYNLY
jgi:hypothetical protein